MKNELSSSHSNDPHFERLLQAASRIQSRLSEWSLFEKQASPDEALPGDIWVTKRPDEDSAESWLIILSATKLNGTPILKVAPIFPETIFANDQDAILPAGLLGFEAGVALGCTITTVPSVLSRLVTHAPEEWLSQLQQFELFLNGSAKRPEKLQSGIPYLDSRDSRRDFHAELLQDLTHAQNALAQEIQIITAEADEVPDETIVEVPFYSLWREHQELEAAADSQKNYTASYKVEGMDLSLRALAFQDDKEIHFIVWDQHGNPSLKLDGYYLRCTDGGAPAVFREGEAHLSLEASRGGIRLENPDGAPIRLTLVAG